MIEGTGQSSRHLGDPATRRTHHVQDDFRSLACRFRSRRAGFRRDRQDRARHQGRRRSRPSVLNANARMGKHHSPAIRAPSPPPPTRSARSIRKPRQGRLQARFAGAQARLTPICSARFVPHCPHRAERKPGSLAILSPIAERAGAVSISRCELKYSRGARKVYDNAGRRIFRNGTRVGTTARYLAVLLLPAMLAACQTDHAGTIRLSPSTTAPPAVSGKLASPKSWRSCAPISTIPSACARRRSPSRCSGRSGAGCAMSSACALPNARSDGTYRDVAGPRGAVRQWPARPHAAKCRPMNVPERFTRHFRNWKKCSVERLRHHNRDHVSASLEPAFDRFRPIEQGEKVRIPGCFPARRERNGGPFPRCHKCDRQGSRFAAKQPN